MVSAIGLTMLSSRVCNNLSLNCIVASNIGLNVSLIIPRRPPSLLPLESATPKSISLKSCVDAIIPTPEPISILPSKPNVGIPIPPRTSSPIRPPIAPLPAPGNIS